MSKHNYTQYSSKKRDDRENFATTPAKVKMVVEPSETAPAASPDATKVEPVLVTETVETVTLPKTVDGVVVNCAKLNVRTEPDTDADIICVLDVTSEIEIDVDKSTKEWFKICTATGIEGYCMRKFVDAHL